MKPYRIEAEHPDHFVVHDGESSFKVAKPRLAHATVERIRKFAQGGEVPSELGEPDPSLEIQPDPNSPGVLSAIWDKLGPGGMENPASAANRRAEADSVSGPGPGIARDADALPDGTPAPVIPAAAVAPQQAPQPSFPGAPSDLMGGVRQERAGIEQRASATQGESAATTAALDTRNQAMQVMADKAAQDLKQNQAQADAMRADIASSKIDPKRFWNQKSTGQKIGSAIGLILGGIGAGLTKGPNYALQVIEKQTEQDIEAQKLELGKKENMLSSFVQRGHDIQSAAMFAKANMLDVSAGQLQRVAAQYQGQKAAADAQVAIGQLTSQASVLRQQATERSLQIASGQIGLQQAQYQAQAMQQLLKGVAGGGGFDSRVLEMPAFKEFRERSVHLPDGSVAFAKDKEEASKATDSMASVARLKAKVDRMRTMLSGKRNPDGTVIPPGNPVTTDRGQAKAMRADLLSEIGHLHDLNRLSDIDLKLFEDQVPDLTDLVKPNAGKKLDTLGKSIDDKVWSINSAILNRPGRRPGG